MGKLYAPNAKVLVVDDNAINRKIISGLVQEFGIRVTQAGSGSECLELVHKRHFDAIFLDHMMPEMDGFETLDNIRSEPNFCRDVPIVALTAVEVEDGGQKYLTSGFNGYLSKPVMLGEMEKILTNLLSLGLQLELPKSAEPKEEPEQGASVDLGDLPEIEGVDWKYAMDHIMDKAVLLQSVRDFHKLVLHEADRLEKLSRHLDGDGVQEYCIVVHGMKSAAAAIGILPLSALAKELEGAANENRVDEILARTPGFLEQWRSYRDKLEVLAGEPEGGKKQEGQREDYPAVLDLLDQLAAAAEIMDIDGMDESMEKLLGYRMPGTYAADLEELQIEVTNLEVEKIAVLAAKLKESVNAILRSDDL